MYKMDMDKGIADSTTEVNGAKHEAVRSQLVRSNRYCYRCAKVEAHLIHTRDVPSDYNNNFYNTKIRLREYH